MQQQVKRFPPATRPVQEDGWLSPDGVYYPCGCYNHSVAAREIAGVDSYDLERCGWVHISDSWVWSERELTQPQIDALFDICMVNPESLLGTRIARLLNRCA
jgi:hypothetical protein